MSEEEKGNQGFSADYVKELRNENASWRSKYRDLEAKMTQSKVQVELVRRGVTADASWISIGQGDTVEKAVDNFLEKYPQFVPQENQAGPENPEPPQVNRARPMNTPKNPTNTPGPKPSNGRLGSKTLEEIKKDPTARAALRSQYRALLHSSGGRDYQGD